MGAAGSVAAGNAGSSDPSEVTDEELAVFKKLKAAYEEKKAEEGADDQAIFAHLKSVMGGLFVVSAEDSKKLDEAAIARTGQAYATVLEDIDALVATDTAFLLGPWLEVAKALAAEYDKTIKMIMPQL